MQLLFDIGATKMRLAVSKDGESFSEPKDSGLMGEPKDSGLMGEPKIINTPKNFDEGMATFKKIADELIAGKKIEAVGGGVKGPIDKEKGILINPPNLPEWSGKPFKKELEKMFDAPVFIENDTAVVGLGEAHYGAGKPACRQGRGSEIMVYVTVSTGVGGVRIVDGRIDRNRFGFEPGHQIIDMTGEACVTCNVEGIHGDGKGHLEGYISGIATEKRFGKKAYEITDEKVWNELARWLAFGLNNTILHWSPDVVVLGGQMIVGEPSIDIKVVEKYLKKILSIFPVLPEIREAELKDVGGLYGAMVLIKQNIAN